ncbi:sigma-70 family RNA polymerase sigma factor [Neolewinella lacunae]|uniref:Sigma-70 family RNA polymerase sigma factor n=1 Tax=Neolewinella lacunae TaxID=1517758 RepID=A0A923PS84_9BACT|nr:sigma-70 family RNA polymerase sigma factor [Neolewinella lacunae]MBC6996528.1 sigma-70 family RNA polymerase sigma factor [Neolewinella lacunae]MDN3634907.1 sigma-70 family RNA polymerase sigma factor [Neolewinella lacunae]
MLSTKMDERQDIVLRLLQQRDQEGMRQLFKHYGGALLSIIDPVIRQPEVSEEVLHDVLLKIWENIGAYDAEKSRLFTWMARIARNAAIDRIRSKSFRKQSKTEAFDVTVRTHNELSQTPSMDHIGVSKLLTRLDDNHRSIIELLYLRDFTQTEAAEELGLPLGTIKTRARRAILQLRTLLQREMVWLPFLYLSLKNIFGY